MEVNGYAVCYAPSVQAYVATSGADVKYYNLTDDIVSCDVDRVMDGVSSATVVLQNKNNKYLDLFRPMDRIVITASRDGSTTQRLFTGYITDCPCYTLYQENVTLTCKCTIYRLQRLLWDSNLIESQKLVNRVKYQYAQTDGGLALIARNILTEVAGMPASAIHFQDAIPKSVYDWAYDMYRRQLGDIEAAEEMASAFRSAMIEYGEDKKGGSEGEGVAWTFGGYNQELVFANGGLKIPIFHQDDAAWKDMPWGRVSSSDNIGNSGCGQTCFAMFATYWYGNRKNHIVLPTDVVQVCNDKFSGYMGSYGTAWALWDKLFPEFGIPAPTRANWSNALSALKNGQAVISSQRKGLFANGGHFILLRGASFDGGKVYVNDPASYHWGNRWGNAYHRNANQVNEREAWFTPDEVNRNAAAYWICPKRNKEGVNALIEQYEQNATVRAMKKAQEAADGLSKQ